MRALIYVRISRDPSGQELGVQRQEQKCRELADREGLTVSHVLVDNDTSAYSGKPRPGWEEALNLVKNGRVDVLVSWAVDRMIRHPRDLETLVDVLEGSGTKIRTVTGSEFDLTTSEGRMQARMMGSIARFESERKSERLKAKATQLAEAGKVGGGGHRPFGFESDRTTIREEEAEAIRWASTEVLAGASLRQVCARMPLPTVKGGPWKPTTLRRVLTAPRTAGLREHQGEVVGEAEWDAIIESITRDRLVNVLTDPRRRTNKPGSQRYLLTGGLAVDRFERPLIARPRADGVKCYIATPEPGKPGLRIEAAPVDKIVLDTVRTLLRDGVAHYEPSDADDAETIEMIQSLEAELDELARMRGQAEISHTEWTAARGPLSKRLEVLRGSLGAVERPLDLDDVRERWEGLSVDEMRRVVSAYVESVTVLPAARGKYTPVRERVALTLRVERDLVPAVLR